MNRAGLLGPVGVLGASLLLHLVIMASGALLLAQLERPRRPAEVQVDVLFQRSSANSDLATGPEEANYVRRPEVKPVLLGGQVSSRPDTQRQGRGEPSQRQAINLASRLAELSAARETLNRPDRSQVPRVRSSKQRASREFRRTTPNPMTLTLLSSGTGLVSQRRRVAAVAAGRGTTERRLATVRGGRPQSAIDGEHGLLRSPRTPGEREHVPQSGLSVPASQRVALRANSRLARPNVQRAPAAVPAETRASPSDLVDSRLAVNQRVAALISSSTLGGLKGVGEGGTRGPGAGERGTQVGNRSTHSGPRTGGLSDDATDSRETLYLSRVRRQLRPLTNSAFPLQAKLEGRGGASVVAFRITESGALTDIRVTRPSGVPGFDTNLVSALRRTMLEPPPGGSARLSFRFDAINPPVSRR